MDYPLLSKPTISVALFQQALAHRKSPALSEAQGCWDTCVGWAVNPAVALAMFVAESSCGSAPGWYGINHPTKNWGNLRASPEQLHNDGTFAYYATYAASLNALCWTLVKGGLYLPTLDTVSKMAERWAPSADGNSSKYYAILINELCSTWQALSNGGGER